MQFFWLHTTSRRSLLLSARHRRYKVVQNEAIDMQVRSAHSYTVL